MYDLIGVGFGPSNLALAIALEEQLGWDQLHRRVLFLEKESTSRWHPGLMLPGATLQVSFLKDLVTLRNPTSQHTFVNYLKHQGRLDEFVNVRTFFPSRNEFAGYIKWVADHFSRLVRYDSAVKIVTPLRDRPGGPVVALRIEKETGETFDCRNIVAASGGTPMIPHAFRPTLGPRVFHSSEFLVRIPPPDALRGATVAVVGSGQSSGEVLHYLLTNAPDTNLVSIFRDFALRPMDDSKFVNEVFSPRMVDFTYGLPKRRREEFLESVHQANYSSVDMELIDELYRLLYEARVCGRDPLRFLTHSSVDSARQTETGITMRWLNQMTGDRGELIADYVVLATGFDHPYAPGYMRPLMHFFEHTEGHPWVSRDYRLVGHEGFEPEVYVQGFAEKTHGISDTLLSMAAHRAGIIASRLAERIGQPGELPGSSNGQVTGAVDTSEEGLAHVRHTAG